MPVLPTPKDRFTALDTLAVVRELRTLGPAHVDKAFDLPESGWSLVLRATGLGRRELVLVPGRYCALLAEPPTHAEELTPLAKELRRLLTGATLRSVLEPGGERVVQLTFSRSGEASEFLLVFEIFGTGNLLVVRDGKILAVASPRRWAHRSVRVGADYAPPPGRPDPWRLSVAEIASELGRSRSDIASTLAARLSLGGPIAEELIVREGWNPGEAPAPRASEWAPRLHAGLARLLSEVGDRPIGFVYLRDGDAVDATPYASARWASEEAVVEARREAFSLAAREYFATLAPAPTSGPELEAARARQSLEHLADQQRQAIADLADQMARRKSQAEAIYAHYSEAEAALGRPRPPEAESRESIDVELGGTIVPLRVDRDPRASAQGLFEESKRLGTKLAGARSALEATERRLSAPAPPPAPRAPADRAAGGARRARWFEKYRWFVSSEGAVVVAGRDASSNDLVVKRHLKDGDFYVHADLHGAASVVVKHPADGDVTLTDVTFREAGQWAVAYSKAWRAGLASGSAFWVTPEQVSKSSESGEFVARGAWVIRGTKHLLRDLPLELGLGPIDYDGAIRWTVAPPAALRRRGEVRVLLTPGDERERAQREVELARELSVPRPLLQSLLPAGGLTVRRP